MFLNKNTFGRKALSVMLAAAMISSVAITSAVTTTAADTTQVESQATTTTTESFANKYGLVDNIQDGNILHCFCWKYTDITAMLPEIAEAGFTSVQVSPPQPTSGTGSWWWFYQPQGFYIGSSELGNKTELTTLCTEAEKYGIKVIADIVANHLAGDHSNIDSELKDSQYWHDDIGDVADGNRYQVTHGKIGMPDLNTEHSFVQQKVATYVKELESIGVDGIRWDAAKHIGLPSEGDNFWSTVTSATDLWHYGEILNNPGVDADSDQGKAVMKEYSNYMSVTDSTYGMTLRNAFHSGTVTTAYGNWCSKGISNDKLIYWGESHDTWSNNNDWGYSHHISQNNIDRAYAVAASRDGIAALYFSRPSTNIKDNIKIGVKGSTHFTSTEVAAVNHFNNAMNGQKDYYTTGSNCSVVCREKGAVIVAGSGSNFQVSVPNGGSTTAPGTYTDEITGNTWTVTSSTISGTIGSTGIAVIYDQTPISSVSATPGNEGSTYKYKTDTLTVTLNASNVTNAKYSLDGGTATSYTDGQTITIGSGKAFETSQTLTLTATDSSGSTVTETYTYYKTNQGTTIYFDNSSYNWSNVYAYIYTGSGTTASEVAAWPGVQLTAKSATSGYYYYDLPDGYEDALVIWSDGTDSTSNRYPADMEPGLSIGGTSKLFTSGNTWKDYSESPTDPTDPTVPTSTDPTDPTDPPVGSYVKGDATGDNKVGMKDCAVIQKYLLGSMTLDSTKQLAADVNGDGEIGTTDVVIIMKYLVGFTNTYGVGSVVSGPDDPTDPTDPTVPTSSNYVYYYNSNGWSSVNAYYWSDANTTMTTWPGVAMTSLGNNEYRVEVPSDATYVIFNNNGSSQTDDLTISRGKIYKNGSWVDYNPTDDPTDPTDPVGDNVVYLNDSAIGTGTERYAVYVWKSESDSQWISMTSAGTNLYQATIPSGYTNIIFCRMNGATTDNSWSNVWNQSADLTFSSSQNLYTATGWGSSNLFNGNWSSK